MKKETPHIKGWAHFFSNLTAWISKKMLFFRWPTLLFTASCITLQQNTNHEFLTGIVFGLHLFLSKVFGGFIVFSSPYFDLFSDIIKGFNIGKTISSAWFDHPPCVFRSGAQTMQEDPINILKGKPW